MGTSPPDVGKVFGERVRQSRKARAWTQEDLSRATKAAGQRIDRAVLSRIESNARAVQIGEALVIAASLGVALDYLLTPLDSDGRLTLGSDSGAPSFTAGEVSAWLLGDSSLPGLSSKYLWGAGPIGRNPVATGLRGLVKHAESAADARQAAKVARAGIALLQGLLPTLALDSMEG